jgi:hypothetical protein
MRVKEPKFTQIVDELKFDAVSANKLVGYLRTEDKKLQRMLLWCSVSVMIAYMSVIITILKYYSFLPGHHAAYLGTALFLIYILFGIFLWLQYRISTYKPTATQIRLKEFCRFKLQVTSRQIKMLSGYLIAYALIVITSCLACWLEADNDDGAEKIIKITAPISILVYVTGIYLLGRLGIRWNLLNDDIRRIDSEILNGIQRQ